MLDQCQTAGLLPGWLLGTDSTQIDANASMDSLWCQTLQYTCEAYILALHRQEQPDATPGEAK